MEVTRKCVIALVVLLSTAVVSIPAIADGSDKAYANRDYYPSIWRGLYAGVHVGFGDGDGVLGGGQLGYNWQSDRLVYGIEADFALSSIEQEVSLQLVRLRPRQLLAGLDGNRARPYWLSH